MDTIANMINGIKNANHALNESVIFPHSKLSYSIAEKLSKEGYIGAVSKKVRKGRPVIEVTLATVGGEPRIHEVSRVSKPSRRMYASVHAIKPFKNGRGTFFFSTPKGILTDKEARKENVGGEILFKIW